MRELNLKLLIDAMLLLTLFSVPVLGEPGQTGGHDGGDGGHSDGGPGQDERARADKCNQAHQEVFRKMGRAFENGSLHHAFRIYEEQKVQFDMSVIMVESFFCHLGEGAKEWDGTTLPYTIEKSFHPGGDSSTSDSKGKMAVKMAFDNPPEALKSKYNYSVTISVKGPNDSDYVKVASAAWKGDAKNDRTSGELTMNNPAKFQGEDRKESHRIVWDREEATQDEVLGGSNSLEILSSLSHSGDGRLLGNGREGSDGFRDHVTEGKYVKSGDKFFLKINRVQGDGNGGTHSFQVFAERTDKDADGNVAVGMGRIAVTSTMSGSSAGESSRGIGSHMSVYIVNFDTKKVISEESNHPMSGQRYQFRRNAQELQQTGKAGQADFDVPPSQAFEN